MTRFAMLSSFAMLLSTTAMAAPAPLLVNSAADDSVCDASTCSLRGAIAATEVGYTNKIMITAGLRITLTAPLQLTRGVTIEGTDARNLPIISGNYAHQIFVINHSYSGSSFTFKNLKLETGFTNVANKAGGISVESAVKGGLVVRNCKLEMNRGMHGGAIRSGAMSVTIEDSELVGNQADVSGGALFTDVFDEQSISVTNTAFSQNVASTSGGAMYFAKAQPSTKKAFPFLRSVRIITSDAQVSGAIHSGPGSSLTVRQSAFHGNLHGVITFQGDNLEIAQSTFSKNSGGAINTTGGAFELWSNTFMDNTGTALSATNVTGFQFVGNVFGAEQLCNVSNATGTMKGDNVVVESSCKLGANDLVTSDVMLDQIKTNGPLAGDWSHRPLAGSPVLDRVTLWLEHTADQLGNYPCGVRDAGAHERCGEDEPEDDTQWTFQGEDEPSEEPSQDGSGWTFQGQEEPGQKTSEQQAPATTTTNADNVETTAEQPTKKTNDTASGGGSSTVAPTPAALIVELTYPKQASGCGGCKSGGEASPIALMVLVMLMLRRKRSRP